MQRRHAVQTLVVGLLAAMPSVAAQVYEEPTRQVWSFGRYVASLEADGIPYVDAPSNWTLRLILGPNAAYAGNASTVRVTATQQNQTLAGTVSDAAHGLFRVGLTFPGKGNWTLRVRVQGGPEGSVVVPVFPALGYRILAQSDMPAKAGEPTLVTLTTLGNPPLDLPSVILRFETTGNRTLPPARLEINALRQGTEWKATATFPQAGSWRIAIAAPGVFSFGDMPFQDVDVAASTSRATPAIGPVGILAFLGLAWMGHRHVMKKGRSD